MEEAKNYLSNSEAYRRDVAKNDFRTPEQLDAINSTIDSRADDMSIDFIDELEAKGIQNPDDFETKSEIIENVLISYRKKVFEWLQKL